MSEYELEKDFAPFTRYITFKCPKCLNGTTLIERAECYTPELECSCGTTLTRLDAVKYQPRLEI